MKPSFLFGFDIGSISINTVVMGSDGIIVQDRYDYCHGKPFEKLKEILDILEKTYSRDQFGHLSFTGTGGKLAAEILGGTYVNEIVAQSTSVSRLYPQIRTIIEMGGEDSKLIFMDELDNDASRLSDFELNTLCAAGTGSFLDQQAGRLEIDVEDMGEIALSSENPSTISGRCTVFAETRYDPQTADRDPHA